ncbi:MAG: histidine kinase [Ignavibacteria bacterium]|nr:histidine kinase [Ignavibacteria bacterium]
MSKIQKFVCIFVLLLIGRVFAGQRVEIKELQPIGRTVLKHIEIAPDPNPAGDLCMPTDSAWRPFDFKNPDTTYRYGNWILKSSILIPDTLQANTAYALYTQYLISAYQIYWDRKLLQQNGRIGYNELSELPGKLNGYTNLSASVLTPGSHEIVLRFSTHHINPLWYWYYSRPYISSYQYESDIILKEGYIAALVVGFVLIPLIFNLFLYFNRKHKPEHLIFSILCLLVIVDAFTGQLPSLYALSNTSIYSMYRIYQLITLLFSTLFPVFFVLTFKQSKKVIWAIVILNLFTFFVFTDSLTIFQRMSLLLLIQASLLTVWALFKRREDSLMIAGGIVVAWIAYAVNFVFNGFSATMVVCVSLSIARRFVRQERTLHESELRSAHLENELLKKNISPHFLLNSLTSIIVWLRREPGSAIKLIESLAQEFRMVNQISALKLIHLFQELDLCRMHLNIMSLRKGAEFQLDSEGIKEDIMVPPMILHTLIENGITHGYSQKMHGVFTVSCKKNQFGFAISVLNDGDFSNGESPEASGFGMKYIQGRLEESFPGKWAITSGARTEGGWQTEIILKGN